MDLFSLNDIKNKQELEAVEANAENHDGGSDLDEESDLSDEDDADDDADDSDEYIYGDDELYEKKPGEREADLKEKTKQKKKMKKKNDEKSENPLIHQEVDDEEDAANDAASRAAMWYQKEAFKDVDNDDDDDYENEKDEGDKENTVDNSDDDDDDDSDVDSDIDDRSIVQGNEEDKPKKTKGDTFEIAPQTKVGHLDEVGLAIGTAIATSRKRKRDIIDDSYHRYSYGKEVLPKWFTEDEAKHKKRPLPVTREEVEAYKERMREINARPIKKVIEAKAKKKDKMLRKLEKVRKRAEGVLEASDTSEREKQQQIKGMYKRAGLLKKKREKVTYVVAKKSQAGKNYARPSGVKGQYKVVDPRLKKDLRAAKLKEKTKKRGKRKN